jgi:hypothetical protein
MTRYKAATTHLGISFLVVGTIVALVFFFWFPYGLIRIAGMDRLFLTMLMVDIVAGPMLTLIVFKRHDMRSTRHDLVVIALLQAAFLGYALHTAWVSRPVFLVWSVDQMYLLYANEIEPEHLREGKDDKTRSLSWTGPRLYAVNLPQSHEVRAKIFTDLIEQQTSLERLPQYYGDYGLQTEKLLRASVAAKPESLPVWMTKESLRDAIDASGRQADSMQLVALNSSRSASFMLVDAKTGRPILALAPPPVQDTDDASTAPAP